MRLRAKCRRAATRLSFWVVLICLHLPDGLFASEKKAESKKQPVAKLKISGYGLFGNRQLQTMLRMLDPDKKKPFYDASYVEDAALLLMSRLQRDGHLRPVITAKLVTDDGQTLTFTWDEPLEPPLPRPLRVRQLHFRIKEGRLYYFDKIRFEGLETVKPKEAKAFFVETGTLLPVKGSRIYSAERLEQGISSLTETLARQGFKDTEVTATNVNQNHRNGRVSVTIQTRQGAKFMVRSVRKEVFYDGAKESNEAEDLQPHEPYSRVWQQNFIQAIKTNYYARGYPDTEVTVEVIEHKPRGKLVEMALLARVQTGSKIKVGEVWFEGHRKTRESVLNRRVEIEEGSLLDRVKAEHGRYRLSRLGVFDSVGLRYDAVDDETRDVVYELHEGKQLDFSLLFGYGSYERLRGGFELDQNNVFGLGHHARLRAAQSFKSSSGDYTYTIPELIRSRFDVFFNASALRREEISFTREEFTLNAGLHRYYRPIFSDAILRYSYQVLGATDTTVPATEGKSSANVGAFIGDFKHDRRDNPLYPHKGYKVFANLEVASDALAGNANYERFEFAASLHQSLGGGRWMHFGVAHGALFPDGDRAENLPFNKRFFPGGENSVRGFQQGEAAPRDENGNVLGAECYVTANVEFEQALTPARSVVGFFDAIGFARRIGHYPLDEALYSAGGGLRWRTIVGPIRLEYGHNLNPRAHDPSGTLHFSLGFPF